MAEEDSKAISPPYISFRTFLNLIERLAESGIPQHIDRSYWKPFLSGSLGPQVMAALRFFVLITGADNEPTPDLEHLVEDKEQRKQIFEKMLRKYYAPVFADVDLARTTTGFLEKTFTKCYKLSPETRRKSITFFLHAAQYVGFPLSSHLKEASRTRSVVAKSSSRASAKKPHQNGSVAVAHETPTIKTVNVPPQTPFQTKTINLRTGGNVTLTYSVDLFGIDKQDREFLFGLIDQLQDYEQENFEDGMDDQEVLEEEEEE